MRSFLLVLLIQAIVSAVSLEQEQPIAIVRVEDRLASNEVSKTIQRTVNERSGI